MQSYTIITKFVSKSVKESRFVITAEDDSNMSEFRKICLSLDKPLSGLLIST